MGAEPVAVEKPTRVEPEESEEAPAAAESANEGDAAEARARVQVQNCDQKKLLAKPYGLSSPERGAK